MYMYILITITQREFTISCIISDHISNYIKLFEYSLSDKMKGTVFNKVSK